MQRCFWMIILLVLWGCGQATNTPASPEVGAAASATAVAKPTVPFTPAAVVPPTHHEATPTAAPTMLPTPTPTPLAPQSLALRPLFANDLRLEPWPEYRMSLEIDPLAGRVQGSQIITYTNQTSTTLNDLMVRSYVNFPPDVLGDGGTTTMNLLGAWQAEQPLPIQIEAQNTAFRLSLLTPLAPGNQTIISTRFAGTLEPWDDGSWLFLSAYPMLAVWDPLQQDWHADVTSFPDHVYAQSALYDVDVTLPSIIEVFATGSAIASSSDGVSTTTRFVSGPVREWAASLGQFEQLATHSNGITVTVYQVTGSPLDLQAMLDTAVDSLAVYEQRIGPYPYRELDLHASLWRGDAGIEFPGYTVILVNQQVNQRTDFVIAHEVAHQWWYAVVGNDIYRAPWLDESFANFSSIVAFEDSLGAAEAQAIYEREIERSYLRGVEAGDAPAGLAIYDYASFNSYYWAVYGKGAVFLLRLRDELGAEVFWQGLQAYYAATRYNVATRALFQQTMETAAGRSLEPFFDQWLE